MTPQDGLDVGSGNLPLILSILARHIPSREVWAFGSRVAGRAREFSDLDLCIVGDTPLASEIRAALVEDFAESDLPYKVDLVDWAMTSQSFRDIIAAQKIILRTSSM